MANILENILTGLKQTVTVGGKTGKSSGLPVELTIKLDPDFSRTILKATATIGASIVVATAINAVVAGNRKRNR